MKNPWLRSLFLLCLISGITLGFARTEDEAEEKTEEETPEAKEAYDKMMQALTHKRCLNCHPSGDRPRQGEDSHYHYFGVSRGEEGHGVAALQCSTCHQTENNNYSGVPGAPHWHLAPSSMAWEGLSRAEIAESILDPERNGGRSLEEIVKHMTEDALVLWAWEPGVNANGEAREKPPVSKEEFIQAVKDWAAAGAPIPETESK